MLTNLGPVIQHGDTLPILALPLETVTLCSWAQPPLAVRYGQLSTFTGCLSWPMWVHGLSPNDHECGGRDTI